MGSSHLRSDRSRIRGLRCLRRNEHFRSQGRSDRRRSSLFCEPLCDSETGEIMPKVLMGPQRMIPVGMGRTSMDRTEMEPTKQPCPGGTLCCGIKIACGRDAKGRISPPWKSPGFRRRCLDPEASERTDPKPPEPRPPGPHPLSGRGDCESCPQKSICARNFYGSPCNSPK